MKADNSFCQSRIVIPENVAALVGAKFSSVKWAAFICLCAVILTGCETDTAIVSKPGGATVAIDGANIGTTPVRYKFDFSRTPTSVVTAAKEGYENYQLAVDSKSPALRNGALTLVLHEDEAYKVTTTSDAANNWLRVQVDPSLAPDLVWQKLVDSVTSRYSSLEMVDAASGYMRSVYIIKKFPHSEGYRWVRTRFICSISSKTPLVYKLKIESESFVAKNDAGAARITDPQQQDWELYPRIFKEDQQLIDEITGRLSVK
jgi:hypothetical protein